MTRKTKSTHTAFSLIELSVVILIISIIITGAVSVSKSSLRAARYKVTRDRMEVINKALTNFVAANRRLPCPAVLNLPTTNSSFGSEATTPGTCTGISVGAGNHSNLRYGMIPTTALGLSSEMAGDGFDTKFTYIVDSRMTLTTANTSLSNGFEYVPATVQGSTILPTGAAVSLITIKEGSSSGNTVNNIAIYAIVSHGANKLGGYNINGTSINSGASGDELDNAVSGTLDNVVITNSTTTSFDDIISYKTKLQLVYDAGLQFIMCSSQESRLSGVNNVANTNPNYTVTWTTNQYYNNTSTTISGTGGGSCATGSASRICGQYGIWGAVTTNCTT